VTQFAGRAGGAAVDASVEDQAGADSGGCLDVDEVPQSGRGAEGHLAECRQVRVVVEEYRQADEGL